MIGGLRRSRVKKYFYDSLSGHRTWQRGEIFELMNSYEKHKYLFGVMSSDEDVWILIASNLQDRGIEVTARQVSAKWTRMRETFKKIGEAESLATKELQKPLKMVSFEAPAGFAENFFLSKPTAGQSRPLLSQLRTPSRKLSRSAVAATRQLDDYETLKTMYKLSLLRD